MWRAFGRFSWFCLLSPVFCILSPEIIDRIAISAGNQIITAGQIEEEIRVTDFLNRENLDLSLPAKKQAAGRLIEQTLVRREMEFSRYPQPDLSDADASLKSLKAHYAGEAEYREALRQYGISEDALRQRLWWQLTLVRFVDYRFRPGIQVTDPEMHAYYQQQLAKWQQQGVTPLPSFEDARDQIGEILVQQKVDENLEKWLAGARAQVTIRYHDEALR